MTRVLAALVAGVVVLLAGTLLALSLLSSPASATSGSFSADAAGQLGLTPAQLDQARRALTVADEVKAPPLAVLSMVCAALGESGFEPVKNPHSKYAGVFQADPANIPMDDTEGQARAFQLGDKGFQAGGAIRLATDHPLWTPGLIATMVETSGQPAGFYDQHRPQAEKIIAAWVQGAGTLPVAVHPGMTAKQIIDTIVLPICNRSGIALTPAEVEAANASHGPTKGGGRSDHQGPPDAAWAADMSNGVTTPQEDALAAALARQFRIPWSGAGLVSVTRGGYRFQLIYRINTPQAGDHFNHVHFGVRVG
jgi:hypothetical protein